MRLIEEGNFKEWIRICFVIAGIALVVYAARRGLSSVLPKIFFSVGIIVAAVGGYASQAHMLQIRPFDNSYKKARDSYNVEDQ
jgi:TRAP-type uncharacterized transport system fused permease subunit